MLLLYFFLLSCCLSASMGDAIEEFKANLKAFVKLNSEIFLQVPKGHFKCNCVHHQLNSAMEQLGKKKGSEDNEMITRVSLMKGNLAHIIRNITETYKGPKEVSSCKVRTVDPQTALYNYDIFFQRLNEANFCAPTAKDGH